MKTLNHTLNEALREGSTVELKGVVRKPNKEKAGRHEHAYFSLETKTEKYRCEAWSGRDIDLSKVEDGKSIRLSGRVKLQTYGSREGTDKAIPLIWVARIYD